MTESTAPQSEHRTVLLRGGDVHSPADPFATAMVVERGHVAWVGSEGAADAFASGVDEVIDLEGALVTPAFTDSHVHTTSTGLALTGLDLSGARSLAEALGLVRAFANGHAGAGVILGHGWDAARWPEQRPPSRGELDEAAGGRAVYLPRVDVHSAVVTTALLDLVPGVTELRRLPPRRPADRRRPPRGAGGRPRRRHAGAAPRGPACRPAHAASWGSATRARVRGPGDLGRGGLHRAAEARLRAARPPGLRILGRARRGRRRAPAGSASSVPSARPATSSSTAPWARTPPSCTSRTPTPRTRHRPARRRAGSPHM